MFDVPLVAFACGYTWSSQRAPHRSQNSHHSCTYLRSVLMAYEAGRNNLGRGDLRNKLVSASVGALLTSLTTTPIEVVKTRMQTIGKNNHVPANRAVNEQHSIKRETGGMTRAVDAANLPGRLPKDAFPHGGTSAMQSLLLRQIAEAASKMAIRSPTSAISIATSLVRNEGVGVLWSGLAPSLVMAVPSTALYFVVYEELKQYIEGRDKSSSGSGPWAGMGPFAPLVAGVAGRSVTVAVVAPLELIRTVAMFKGGLPSQVAVGAIPPPVAVAGSVSNGFGIAAALRAEIATGGIISLWRGLSPTLWRDVPFSGIYWLSYERLKHAILRRMVPKVPAATQGAAQLSQPSPSFQQTFGATFAAGMTAGSLAAAVTTPFDVIKTRRQVRYMQHQHQQLGTSQPVLGAPAASNGTVSLLRQLLATEGWAGLFAGVQARVAKVAPSCAIMISSYEVGKRLLAPAGTDLDAGLLWGKDADEGSVTPNES